MLFQTLDALAHRAVSDVHLLRGVREIQVTGSRFEKAKRLERRKYARHAEMIAALTAYAKNHRWPASHRRSKMRTVSIDTKQESDDIHFARRRHILSPPSP
jgi:hypothetical protein